MSKITLKNIVTKQKGQSPFVMLIHAIWKRFGGAKVVADKLGTEIQEPVNWKARGHVPIRRVEEVARVLGIDPWGLNYKDKATQVHPDFVPTFEKVVRGYKFDKAVTNLIILAYKKWQSNKSKGTA